MMWYLVAYIIIEIIFISVFSLIVNKNDAYQQKLEDEEQLKYIRYVNQKKTIKFKKKDLWWITKKKIWWIKSKQLNI